MAKIPAERLAGVADFIAEGSISGSHLARAVGMPRSTFHIYMNERGLEVPVARKLAAALDREATKLREVARQLRDEINDT
jgi:hypothetical protein